MKPHHSIPFLATNSNFDYGIEDEPSHVREAVPRRIADQVVETLSKFGVNTYLGIPGGAIGPVYDALAARPELRVINTRHETGAVFMAMGHARVARQVACLLMTSGPGITNAITGLAAAYADSIPLIAIGGEVPRKNFGRGALQEGSRYELDILGMVRSVTKFSAELRNPGNVTLVLQKALECAVTGRPGPVFLSLPIDVASEETKPFFASPQIQTHYELSMDSIEAAASALRDARRGLLFVGSGARHPQSTELIRAVAQRLQIPVMTTPKAKGLFPEGDPLSLGIFGYGGHQSAKKYLEEGVDVLCCIGCGLGETGTNGWSPVLIPKKTFIQIDIDPTQIGKNYEVDLPIIGPAHRVLRELVSRIPSRPAPVSGHGIVYDDPIEGASRSNEEGSTLHPAAVIRLLQDRLPKNTIFSSDIGEHLMFALHYLKIEYPDAFLAHVGLGSMGSGIGSAIGAKVAAPERPVCAICGDFGFQMFGMEISTCVQSRIGTVFAIMNDGRMKMVERGLTNIFGRTLPMDAPHIDFAALARSVGANGFTIRRAEDFVSIPDSALNGDVPTVLDIMVDPIARFSNNARVAEIKGFVGRKSSPPPALKDR